MEPWSGAFVHFIVTELVVSDPLTRYTFPGIPGGPVNKGQGHNLNITLNIIQKLVPGYMFLNNLISYITLEIKLHIYVHRDFGKTININ